MQKLAGKLKHLKSVLKDWNRDHFGNLNNNLRRAEDEVLKAEHDFQTSPSPANRAKLNGARADLLFHSRCEEAFWRQKSRIKWAAEGDANTAFFHGLCQDRRSKLQITKIRDSPGNMLTDDAAIEGEAIVFFQHLLSAEQGSYADMSLLDVIPSIITNEDNAGCCAFPSHSEMLEAVFSLSVHSAPGIDGYSGMFYTQCWDILEDDVCLAVRDYWAGLDTHSFHLFWRITS